MCTSAISLTSNSATISQNFLFKCVISRRVEFCFIVNRNSLQVLAMFACHKLGLLGGISHDLLLPMLILSSPKVIFFFPYLQIFNFVDQFNRPDRMAST